MGQAWVDIAPEPGFIIMSHVLISRYVDEPMLGLDWLTKHEAEWKFGQRRITTDGRVFKLYGAKPTWRIRRVGLSP